MNLASYKIKEENGQIKIYKRFNNVHEIASSLISLVVGISLIAFLLLSFFVIFNSKDNDYLRSGLLIGINVFTIYMIYQIFYSFFIEMNRLWYPILTIQDKKIVVKDNKGRFVTENIDNVRSINATLRKEKRSFLLRSHSTKIVCFSEIFISMRNGRNLYFDSMISSELSESSISELTKELKKKSKTIGDYLSNKLETQFYWNSEI